MIKWLLKKLTLFNVAEELKISEEILSNIDFSNFQYETEEKTTNGSQFIRKYLEELINKFYPPVSETTS